jgi:hypothetical protein
VRATGRKAITAIVVIVAMTVTGGLTGCGPPRGSQYVDNDDPDVKIPAIQQAVRTKDKKAVPVLVNDLDSDDPAVRFYAIEALRRLTGDTMGYNYYEDEDVRKPAVERWKAWLKEQPK